MTPTNLLRVFGLFFSAKLGTETLVVAHMPLCITPRVQLSLAHLQSSPFQVLSVLGPWHKLCVGASHLQEPQNPTDRRPQGAKSHHSSLSNLSFSGSCPQGPMHPKQNLQGVLASGGLQKHKDTINYSRESKNQKSASPSRKWRWKHLHIH